MPGLRLQKVSQPGNAGASGSGLLPRNGYQKPFQASGRRTEVQIWRLYMATIGRVLQRKSRMHRAIGRVNRFPDDPPDSMKLFRHLRHKYMRLSANASTHHQKHFDYCPHCEEKTPWMARVMTGYYRCLQCGNNPLAETPEQASDETAHAEPSATESSRRAKLRKSA